MAGQKELTSSQENFVRAFWESGAYQEGEFPFKFHEQFPHLPLSPSKVSIRREDIKSAWFDVVVASAVDMIYEDVRELGIRYKHVLGIPNAGVPFAIDYSVSKGEVPLTEDYALHTTSSHLLLMNKEVTQNGRKIGSMITGSYPKDRGLAPGDSLLLLDDLFSYGGSKIEAIDAVQGPPNFGVVAHVAAAIDRELFGIDRVRALGISASASLTFTRLLHAGVDLTRITPTQRDRDFKYTKDMRMALSSLS